MRKTILATTSVLALAIGGAGVGFAADGRSSPNAGQICRQRRSRPNMAQMLGRLKEQRQTSRAA